MSYSISTRVGHRVEIKIELGSKTYDIYFSSSDRELSLSAEAIVASLLYPFMASGSSLIIDEVCDKKFLENIETVEAIASDWFDGLNRISVFSETCGNSLAIPDRNTASFFSGGLDSFYTLLKNIDSITDIIFVHGFDVELADTEHRKRCSELVRHVGNHFGKRVIEIETNLRILLDDYVGWGFAHGAAMAAVTHAMSKSIERIYVASSYSYGQLFPWGSHPLLDPMWSSSGLEVIHHGCDASRVEKAAFLGGNEFALSNLRVCWKNPTGKSNCGSCEKCVRTMINFESVGVTGYRQSFPRALTRKSVRSIPELTGSARIFASENLAALTKSGGHVEIRDALEALINRHKLAITLIKYGQRRRRKWYRLINKVRQKAGRR